MCTGVKWGVRSVFFLKIYVFTFTLTIFYWYTESCMGARGVLPSFVTGDRHAQVQRKFLQVQRKLRDRAQGIVRAELKSEPQWYVH